MNPSLLLLVGSILAGLGAIMLLNGYMATKRQPYPSTNRRVTLGALLLGAGLTCLFFTVVLAVMS